MSMDEPTARAASLRTRVVAIAAASAIVVAALIGLSSTLVLDLRNDLGEQRRSVLPAARALGAFREGVREEQRGERGYVITRDDRFLEALEVGRARADRAYATLVRLLADEPELAQQLPVLEAARRQWQREAVEPAVEAARRGDLAAAAGVVADQGRPRFESVLREVDTLQQALDARSRALESRLMERERDLLRLLLTAAATAALIVALVLAALDRWVTTPVERLSWAVQLVAGGALEQPVTVTGPREVVELARDVEAMRLRILKELEEMRRVNEALEQQAPLVVEVRDVLLPAVQAPPAVELASLFLPAEGVLAGDWFDVWTVEDGRLGIVVADISGHGAEAGLFALRLKDLIRSAVSVVGDPGAALRWVADRLGDTGERFATIFVGVVEVEERLMHYASAGHPPVLLIQPATILSLLPTGPLVGPLEARWETRRADLRPGTVLVAYTDGLLEARSPDHEEFGSARLLEVVTRLRGGTPHDIVAGCRGELEAFAAGRFQDDVTLVALTLVGH